MKKTGCSHHALFVPLIMVSLIVAQGLLAACAPDTVTTRSAMQLKPEKIRTIAILPFDRLATPQRAYRGSPDSQFQDGGLFDNNRSITASALPVPERLHAKMITIPSWASKKISLMIYAQLKRRLDIRVISPDQVERAFPSRDPERKKDLEIVQGIGKQFSADAVIKGLVRVYRERSGNKIAAIPAAVGFDVWLVDTATGNILWVGEYYEEQKPLTEDLRGFLERKGTFVSVEELAQSGVNRLMSRFPVGVESMKEIHQEE